MRNLVAEIIANPKCISDFELKDWDLVIRQARNSSLLARIHSQLQASQLLPLVPEVALKHLISAKTQADRHIQLVDYEIDQIYKVLSQLETPVVLLKGAAYVAANLPPAAGRIFTDIDVMVAKDEIDLAEDALLHYGWVGTQLDEYDQKYYRKWMHELPPMMHQRRKSIIDVHHAILPETARLKPCSEQLLKAAKPVENFEYLYTLCPEDIVLHSATHLFHDGEFEHGLRDLVDIDSLLRHFSSDTNFWSTLIARALQIDLARPLFYALFYCKKILKTPVPDTAIDAAMKNAKISNILFKLMDSLLNRGLRPNHTSCRDCFSGIAEWMLYVRSHYLRMPLHLLIPHLFQKSFITPINERKAEKIAAQNPTIQQLLAKRHIKK
jgi:hypothetical protein